MTGEQIRREAIRYDDFEISEEDALAYINEGLRRLGDMALVYGELDVDAEANVSYALPPDALNIVRVEHRGTRRPYDGFRMVADEIIFDRPGAYTIYARKIPPALEFIDEEPAIPLLMHQPLVVFLRGMAKLQDDDASPDGQRLVQQFEEEATRAFRMLTRKRYTGSVRVIR